MSLFCAVRLLAVFCVIGLIPNLNLRAEEPVVDPASLEALQKTQALLNDPALRDAFIQKSPNALMIDGQATSLTGNAATKESLYHISSQVFQDIFNATQGDVGKMQKMMVDAKNDPKAFFNSLSPESRKAIEIISKQIEQAPTSVRAPASSK